MTPGAPHPNRRLTLVRSNAETAERERSDRRLAPRHPASALEWLNGVRLQYGPSVSLIDLSTGGAQIETTNYSLQPGSTVVVQIAGADHEMAVPSSVLRCQISSVGPRIAYRSALAFKRAFEPPRLIALGQESDAVAQLIEEHARIAAALEQLSALVVTDAAHAAAPAPHHHSDVLASMLTMIAEKTGSRADLRFCRHLTQCFSGIATDIEAGADTGSMLGALADRLGRAVPATAVRIVDASLSSPPQRPGPDAVYFDVPGSDTSTRLLVEFPPSYPLERWHLQLLKAAAQLVAVVGDIDRLRTLAAQSLARQRSDAESTPQPGRPMDTQDDAAGGPAAETIPHIDTPPGWDRLVVRYLDGRMLKGYSRTFIPGRGFVNVSPTPEAPAAAAITVPLTQLKAIFFVHDLNGAPQETPQTPGCTGRRIMVSFNDGEELRGSTLNYTSTGPGFFVWPDDRRTNNMRVFVVRGALRRAQLL